MQCMQIVLLAEIASKTFTGTVPVTGPVNLPVMLQCTAWYMHAALSEADHCRMLQTGTFDDKVQRVGLDPHLISDSV